MSGRQYSLEYEADLAALYKRIHILETAGPYDSQISTVNTSIVTINTTLSALGTPVAYSPVWGSATGTNPVIGNGTIKGKYIQIGKLVVAWVSQTHGSTTTYGTGTYNWSLPSTAANTNGVPEMQGSWIGAPTAGVVFGGITDVTQGTNVGVGWLQVGAAAGTYAGLNILSGGGGSPIPAAWASGGSMRMTFIYESTT